MPKFPPLIRFDWAIKNLLRDKANFDILEGFLSALLKTDIKVEKILESEANQENKQDKFNRVDLLVEDGDGRKIIIEIQNNHEAGYLQRLLYGTSKIITETISLGDEYTKISKVISISILYFKFSQGDDYIYYGTTQFHGLHTQTPLQLKATQEKTFQQAFAPQYQIENIFPEYYIIETEGFDDIVKEDIDEWIYFLKNSDIPKEFRSRNIDAAKKKLDMLRMPEPERKSYQKYLENLGSEKGMMRSAHEEGWNKGMKKGMQKGMQEGIKKGKKEGIKEGIKEGERKAKLDIARQMLQQGIDWQTIQAVTGVRKDEVK